MTTTLVPPFCHHPAHTYETVGIVSPITSLSTCQVPYGPHLRAIRHGTTGQGRHDRRRTFGSAEGWPTGHGQKSSRNGSTGRLPYTDSESGRTAGIADRVSGPTITDSATRRVVRKSLREKPDTLSVRPDRPLRERVSR